MRRKASFAGLLYREWLLCKKALVTYTVTSLIFTLIPILIILSLQYGNLTMLPEHIVTDIRANNDLMLTLYAVISPCMLVISLAESAIFDTRTGWDHFRRSTPVKPVRMAMAKYTLVGLAVLVSAAAAVVIMVFCHWLLGTPVLTSDVAVIMTIITLITLISVLAQVFIMLLRSVDKGMLAMIGCMAAVIFLIPSEWKENISADRLLSGSEALLPLTPVILLAILLPGFGLTTFIYARREK